MAEQKNFKKLCRFWPTNRKKKLTETGKPGQI